MVGGYVTLSVPAILGEANFVSGTKVPGIYNKLGEVFATGKVPVCHFDGDLSSGAVTAPFITGLAKLPNGAFAFSINKALYIANPDDMVSID